MILALKLYVIVLKLMVWLKLSCSAKIRNLVIHGNRPLLQIALNYSILCIFQIFILEWKLDLVNFISLVGLKFKKYHFNDSNSD